MKNVDGAVLGMTNWGVIPGTARDLLFALAQPHAGEIEQQFRLPIAAKYQPCDQHGDDQSKGVPNEATRPPIHADQFTPVRSPAASFRHASPRRWAAPLRRAFSR